MPELPEVETIRGKLEKYLIGHEITGADVHYKNFGGQEEFLVGGRVKSIRRFGKVIAIDLDNGYSLVIHIKLTGQLIYRGSNLKGVPELSKKFLKKLRRSRIQKLLIISSLTRSWNRTLPIESL